MKDRKSSVKLIAFLLEEIKKTPIEKKRNPPPEDQSFVSRSKEEAAFQTQQKIDREQQIVFLLASLTSH